MDIKKLFISGIAALSALAVNSAVIFADDVPEAGGAAETETTAAETKAAEVRTPEQITSYIKEHPFDTSTAAAYSKAPDMEAPYDNAGTLENTALTNGLNALNTVRYIAGLDAVTFDGDYNKQAQAAAYIGAINKKISHAPDKPEGLADAIWEIQACGTSNLARGYVNIAGSVLAYMNDSDEGNIAILGHRRWCLNPVMGKTGFGQVDDSHALYAFDSSAQVNISGVAWPAQNMPIEYFGDKQAWSWSQGSAIADADKVKVTLTRSSDKKKWTFSNEKADGFFEVSNDSYGAPGCVIFRPDDIALSSGDTYSVKITGLENNAEYNVNFFSVDEQLTPPAVKKLKATAAAAKSVTLEWNKSDGAKSYRVDVYKDGKWTTFGTVNTNSCKVTGLESATSYNFRVFAMNGDRKSSSVKVTASTKPASVKNLKASASTTDSITLKWSKIANSTGYKVDIYKDGKWTKLTKTAKTSYKVTGLKSTTSYNFRVTNYQGTEASAAVKLTASTKPVAVKALKASSVTTKTITLKWNNISGADSFQVDIYKDGKWKKAATVSTNTCKIKNLSPNKTYNFRVWTFKDGAHSEAVGFKATTKALASSELTAVTGLSSASNTENSITLKWNASANADRYQVDIFKNGSWTKAANTKDTTCKITGLSPSTTYEFRVWAFNGTAHSKAVTVKVSTKTSDKVPSTVTGLRAASSTKNSITLSWDKVADADSYQIDIYKDGKWTKVGKVTKTTCTATGLKASTSYDFRVWTFKGTAHSSTVTISASTSEAPVVQ